MQYWLLESFVDGTSNPPLCYLLRVNDDGTFTRTHFKDNFEGKIWIKTDHPERNHYRERTHIQDLIVYASRPEHYIKLRQLHHYEELLVELL